MFGRRRRSVRELAQQFDALQSDLTALRKDARDVANGFSKVAGTAVGAAQNAYGDARKQMSDDMHAAMESISGQPLTACLVSLGIGAVLGALFLRR